MLSKIEELEIRVGELVKENHELREAGERLAKENIDKHFALKKHAECNYKRMKEIEALQKELKWLKTPKILPVEKTLNVGLLQPEFDIHAEVVRQLSEYRARQLETELIKLPKEFTIKGKIEGIKKPAEEKLEVGKWYHTDDFTLENLQKLLPIGTTVMVEQDVAYDNIETEPPSKAKIRKVEKITTRFRADTPLIDVGEVVSREWFKIIEEN